MIGMTVAGVVRCPSIVGRDAELEAIGVLLGAIRAGAGGALMLEGDAGLGKSRLVGEAVSPDGGKAHRQPAGQDRRAQPP